MPMKLDSILLKQKTLQLLAEVGIHVEHEELIGIMLDKGCSEGPTGRIRIPSGLIEEFVAVQEKTRSEDDDDQQRILDECDQRWRANIARREPP